MGNIKRFHVTIDSEKSRRGPRGFFCPIYCNAGGRNRTNYLFQYRIFSAARYVIINMRKYTVIKILLIFIGIFCFHLANAQDSDKEQENLQLCYQYSKLLNCEVESLPYPDMYQTIYEWLGTPYRYSGDCKEGVDCSGFVCMLYKESFGVTLANSSAEIFKETKPVKKSALKEGDLVFFKIKKKKISHVGVYIGHNKFAHASVQNGVIISDLDEPYYKKYFYKGGRVKKGN